MDGWAEHIGLEPGEIHDAFSPFYYTVPYTDGLVRADPDSMQDISEVLYPGGVDNLVEDAKISNDYNNPMSMDLEGRSYDLLLSVPGDLNDGESRVELAFILASRPRVPLQLFQKELHMDTLDDWNSEPNWG